MKFIYRDLIIERDFPQEILSELKDELGLNPKNIDKAKLEINIVTKSPNMTEKICDSIIFSIKTLYDVDIRIDVPTPYRIDVEIEGRGTDLLGTAEIFQSTIKKKFGLFSLKEMMKIDFMLIQVLLSNKRAPIDINDSLLFQHLSKLNLISKPADTWSFMRAQPKKRIEHITSLCFKFIYNIPVEEVPEIVDLGKEMSILEINPNELEKIISKYRSLVYA